MTNNDNKVAINAPGTSGMTVQATAFNWINGVQKNDGKLKPSIDPATYDIIGYYPENGMEAAKAAVAA
uniref:hypothetical protein n=1 Tax=uncultured Sneathiella sp. TaxID=879315 RepID=UPI0030DA0FA5